MKTIVMEGPKKSKVIEVDIPKINDDQILVKVKYTGMCHSEWYLWSVAKKGEQFGHEPMGTIAEIGRNVKGFKVGDRVSGLGGGYSEYIVMSPENTLLIPDNVSDEDSTIEVHGCMLSAASRCPVATVGDTVAVVGAGYMGLGAISLLKLKGAGRIVAVDLREEARENALKFGATEVYSPDNLPDEYILNSKKWGGSDLSRSGKALDIFNTGFKTVIEFTGTDSGLRLAGDMVSAHGYLGIGGYHNDCDRTINFELWNVKAITAQNLHERRSDYLMYCSKNALELLSSGRWNFKGLCNHIYTMEEFDKAQEDMDNKPKGYIKALIKCSD